MQANNSPRFLKNFMIGLVASGAGAFIALPGAAMPEPSETGLEIEAIDIEATTEITEEIAAPTAAEALPTPNAEVLGTEVLETEVMDTEVMDTEVVEAETPEAVPAADTAIVEDEMIEDEMVAEEETSEEITEEVAADEMTSEDAVAAEESMEEETVAESDALEIDADTVEAAEPDTLGDEAIEAADTMDGETVVEDAEVTEEPVAEDAEVTEEPVAEDAEMEEMPVAEEEATDVEPVATEEMGTANFTIAELTDNSESFEILAAALAAADLTEILGSEGPFTVFAPTDDAFAALPEGSVDQLLLPENKDVLVQVLTYHVVPGAILSTDLENGSVATVEGSEVAIAIEDTVTVNNANVVVADVEASNGVIHIIDRVIIPPSPEADADADATAAAVAE